MKLQCKYCLTSFFGEEHEGPIVFAKPPIYNIGKESYNFHVIYKTVTCPACGGAHVFHSYKTYQGVLIKASHLILPQAGGFSPAPQQVPADIAKDYTEANLVLAISAKASAALSRRCLQAILSNAGYTSKNLVSQVEAAIEETSPAKSLPPALRDNMDAIRNFGNFSAHPLTDKTTLQIIEVDAGEAEWCLELLYQLFDHYYVKPAEATERRRQLAEKLASAGKPPMKAA